MTGNSELINSATWVSTKSLVNGIDLNIKNKKSKTDALMVQTELTQKQFKGQQEALYYNYFYGGSALLILMKNQYGESLKKPLLPKDVKKGSFSGFKPLIVQYQIIPAIGYGIIEKIDVDENGISDSTELGKPEYYYVTMQPQDLSLVGNKKENELFKMGFQLVHRSRLLLFTGSPLSNINQAIYRYFGVSIAEKAITKMSKYEDLSEDILKLVNRSNLPIAKIEGLSLQSVSNTRAKDNLVDVMENIIDVIRGISDLVAVGNEDDFKFENADLDHLNEIYLSMKQEYTSAMGAPLNVTFGIDDDEAKYNWVIESTQNRQLRPAYEQIIPVIYRSLFGRNIGDFSFTFKPIENTTNKQKAETLKIISDLIQSLAEYNIISTDEARDMLKSAQENPSDIFNDLIENYLEQLKNELGAKNKETINNNFFQTELAKQLNQNKDSQEKDKNGNGYNMTETIVKGNLMGGKQSKKKPTARVSVVEKEDN